MDSITLRVINWKIFNPRTDVKKPSWFRLAHDLFEDENFYDFSHAEILSWIYILCAASRKNSDTVTISYERLKVVGRIKKKDFLSALKKLKEIEAVSECDTHTSRTRHAGDTHTNATNGRTDETNKTGGDEHACAPPPDMETENAKTFSTRLELEDYYRAQFKAKHKTEPIILPKDEKALERLLKVKGMTVSRLRKVINAYVYMEDPWLSRHGWNLQTLDSEIHKINARVAT